MGDIASPAQWLSTGGNPGGSIRLVDAVVGGVTYFQAPGVYLGDQSAAINSNLSFDLQQTISGSPSQFDDDDVVLTGGGITVVFDLATNPNIGSWSHYEVPLSAPLWHMSTGGGIAPTDAQFTQVLSDLSALRIRAEYQNGPDTGYLDNVAMVPEPGSWAMFLLGLSVFGALVRLRAMNGAAL